MTPSQLKHEIGVKAQEVATLITTTETFKDKPELTKAVISDAMFFAAEKALEVILEAYGEYSKKSPAYDRMRATLVEVKSA